MSRSNRILMWTVGFILFILMFMIYKPLFETNDDGFMAMIVHGFGYFHPANSHIIYSNILLGMLMMHMPNIYGLLPYGYLTISIIVLTFITIMSILLYEKDSVKDYIIVILLLLLLYARIIASPQFSISSGILFVSGALIFLRFHNNLIMNLALLIFILWSYLVRSQEFYLLSILFLPMVLQRKFTKYDVYILFTLIILVVSCGIVDYLSYHNQDSYRNFYKLYKLSGLFVDYKIVDYYTLKAVVLEKIGLSVNDLIMFGKGWVFADRSIIEYGKLEYLINNYSLLDRFSNWRCGFDAVLSMFNPELFPLICIIILTLVVLENKRDSFIVVFMLFLFIIIMLVIGLMGRPSQLRIYYPCLFLICCISVNFKIKNTYKNMYISGLVLMLIFVGFNQYYKNVDRILVYKGVRHELLVNQKLINNGIFEAGISSWTFYAPLDSVSKNMLDLYSLKFHDIGYYSIIPSSISYTGIYKDNVYFKKIFSGNNVTLINPRLDLLSNYCVEHFDKYPIIKVESNFHFISVVNFKC